MKLNNFNISPHGALIGAGLHDGCVNGVLMNNDALWVIGETLNHQSRTLKLIAPAVVNVSRFWGVCLVSDLWLWEKASVPESIWRRLFEGRVPAHRGDDGLQEAIDSVTNQKVFALESSYGGEIYATCDGLEIYDGIDMPNLISKERQISGTQSCLVDP